MPINTIQHAAHLALHTLRNAVTLTVDPHTGCGACGARAIINGPGISPSVTINHEKGCEAVALYPALNLLAELVEND